MDARTSSIPQLIQELLRVKNQLIPGCRCENDGFRIDLLVFFEDGNSHFCEFVGPHLAVIVQQRLFWMKEIIHSFCGLVVIDAVAAELKMSKGYDFVWIVGNGVFKDDFEAEFSFLFYPVKPQKIE